MLNKELVVKRLSKLREYVVLLEVLRKRPRKDFFNDPFVYGNVGRYLQLSIQCVIDICNHFLAAKDARGIDGYREIILLAGKAKTIPDKLAKKIASMAGLRNILVYDYLDIDRAKLYEIVQKNLGDFKKFAVCIAKSL